MPLCHIFVVQAGKATPSCQTNSDDANAFLMEMCTENYIETYWGGQESSTPGKVEPSEALQLNDKTLTNISHGNRLGEKCRLKVIRITHTEEKTHAGKIVPCDLPLRSLLVVVARHTLPLLWRVSGVRANYCISVWSHPTHISANLFTFLRE